MKGRKSNGRAAKGDERNERGGMQASAGTAHSRTRGKRTSEQYRSIQREQDAKSSGSGSKKQEKAPVQAGEREQPTNPLPKQHLAKPGLEKNLAPRPRYDAPTYQGSDKLVGLTALITGGDSGIGRSVAVLFAREGANIAIVYLPDEQADADETQAVVQGEGRECLLIPGDVSDFGFCQTAVEQTVAAFGKLDILVNNAAFQEHTNSLEELSIEQFDRTMKTNIYGYFFMAKASLPYLKEGSSIIMTGSVTAMNGNKSLLDYSATKGAIHTFARSLSQNVMERGIRVNVVAPGPVWTPLNPADAPAEKVKDFGKTAPMHRPAQPEEIAPAYVYLAAPVCSSYVTGEVIPVIGGYAPR